MTYVRMADAAYAQNIPPGFDIAAGYYGGPDEYRQWPAADWGRFPGFKLPIWVPGENAVIEAANALGALNALRVPPGSITAIDLETRKDVTYVDTFGARLHAGGYKVWVYGSASTVFANPPLNGYWVADYTSDTQAIDQLLQHPGVRGVQFASNALFDTSWVKAWTEGEMWHG